MGITIDSQLASDETALVSHLPYKVSPRQFGCQCSYPYIWVDFACGRTEPDGPMSHLLSPVSVDHRSPKGVSVHTTAPFRVLWDVVLAKVGSNLPGIALDLLSPDYYRKNGWHHTVCFHFSHWVRWRERRLTIKSSLCPSFSLKCLSATILLMHKEWDSWTVEEK